METLTPRLHLGLPGTVYAKMGTNVETALLVADRAEGERSIALRPVEGLDAALDAILSDLPDRLPVEAARLRPTGCGTGKARAPGSAVFRTGAAGAVPPCRDAAGLRRARDAGREQGPLRHLCQLRAAADRDRRRGAAPHASRRERRHGGGRAADADRPARPAAPPRRRGRAVGRAARSRHHGRGGPFPRPSGPLRGQGGLDRDRAGPGCGRRLPAGILHRRRDRRREGTPGGVRHPVELALRPHQGGVDLQVQDADRGRDPRLDRSRRARPPTSSRSTGGNPTRRSRSPAASSS